ncbi:LysR substrate-binding domain-containing protein [Bradyrhizobium sp.]|uniref:LysR substrate-binding domain-containing protein n=1 Tax=Bradyrhizobium sp. TaxID=376 RepID=UPI004037E5EF
MPVLAIPVVAGEPIALPGPPAPVPIPEVLGPPAGSEPVTGRAELVVASQHCPLISLDLPGPVCPAARAVVPSSKAAAREIAFIAFPFLWRAVARRQETPDRDAAFPLAARCCCSARWMQANVAAEWIVFRANSLLALRSAAAAGLGVAALPCYFADLLPALLRFAEPLPEMEGSLWLLTHPGLRRVARIRTVLDAMADHLAGRRALIEGCQQLAVPDSGKSTPIKITP